MPMRSAEDQRRRSWEVGVFDPKKEQKVKRILSKQRNSPKKFMPWPSGDSVETKQTYFVKFRVFAKCLLNKTPICVTLRQTCWPKNQIFSNPTTFNLITAKKKKKHKYENIFPLWRQKFYFLFFSGVTGQNETNIAFFFVTVRRKNDHMVPKTANY